MQDFEKFGVFYLGREYDLAASQSTDNLLLYDSKDLCTHAVVVGMTGSGKTGLCIGLLEEAGLDRIPAIVIDPKGDIGNLLLTFPELRGEDFRPWIDPIVAERKGLSVEEYANNEAAKWRAGLASWGQEPDRIKKLRETVEMRIYTPGNQGGRPLTLLKSFAAPPQEVVDDPDALREHVSNSTSGLLGLLGIDADPIRSREHILISQILREAWRNGQDIDLGTLIELIQSPPMEKVGALKLDSFFPEKNRNELAMTINNLLASPTFESWRHGEPLDVKNLLYSDEGKPRISILSLAHLGENERMFFVTILLNEVLSWLRSQSGTSSLRALLYMDEVFGYFPPTRNPPTKQPMLTLLKQARAYGLGIVLATQNPVDLDYKGLANTGTWFLGRLQTERDKLRVLEGLEGASAQSGASFDRQRMEAILAGLGSRKFLMNNVHDDQPVVFETRWVMSYLSGPLTRNQIKKLIGQIEQPAETEPTIPPPDETPPVAPDVPDSTGAAEDIRASIPDSIEQLYLKPPETAGSAPDPGYVPALLATCRLRYVRAAYDVDTWLEGSLLATFSENAVSEPVWKQAAFTTRKILTDVKPFTSGGLFQVAGPLASELKNEKNYRSWRGRIPDTLYRNQPLKIWKCAELKQFSRPGESLGDFKIRLSQVVAEERDEEKEKIRAKFAKKFATLRDRIRRAEDRLGREQSQYKQTRMSSYLNIGSTLMGALLGRRSTRATTTMRSYSRANKELEDVKRAEQNLADLNQKYSDLDQEFNQLLSQITDKISLENMQMEELLIPPRKGEIEIVKFAVAWVPSRQDAEGRMRPDYETAPVPRGPAAD